MVGVVAGFGIDSYALGVAALAVVLSVMSGFEQDMRERIEKSGDMPCEFIMKDISTVRGDVDRVIEWCDIASRVAKERDD